MDLALQIKWGLQDFLTVT